MKAHEMFLNSIENKEQFWAEQADQIHWFKKAQDIGTITILDEQQFLDLIES